MTRTHNHLEDFSEDIISKAQDGLRITNRELSDRAGVELSVLKAIKNGEVDEESLRKIAPLLGLHADRLIVSARKDWLPASKNLPHLHLFVSQFRDMTVNAYLLTSSSGQGILFDTGVDPEPILKCLSDRKISLAAVVLTHGHPDHVAVLDPILSGAGSVPVYAHPLEEIKDTQPVEWGKTFEVGSFRLRALSTPGHTPGGTSFFLQGAEPPIAIVGDALFAGSVGGCSADYERALSAIRENLLSLPAETILCPGHGPITTVAEELENNPFFPE